MTNEELALFKELFARCNNDNPRDATVVLARRLIEAQDKTQRVYERRALNQRIVDFNAFTRWDDSDSGGVRLIPLPGYSDVARGGSSGGVLKPRHPFSGRAV